MENEQSREGDTSPSATSGSGSEDTNSVSRDEEKEIQGKPRPRTKNPRPRRRDVSGNLAKDAWRIRPNGKDDLSETEQFIVKNIQPRDLATLKSVLIEGSEGQIGLQYTQGTLISMIERRFFYGWDDLKIRGWLTMKMYRPETVDRYVKTLNDTAPFVAAIIEERKKKEAGYSD